MIWFVAMAHAVDLSTAVVAWEHVEAGQAGTDGDDRAMGAHLDATGNIWVAGWLDGTAATGHDALLLTIDPLGVELGRELRDSSGDGPLASDDRYYDVLWGDAEEQLILCGQQGSDVVDAQWLLELRTPTKSGTGLLDLTTTWTFLYDEGDFSTVNSCRSVTIDDDRILSVGSNWGNDAIAGMWRGLAIDLGPKPVVDAEWTWDPGSDPDVPDVPSRVQTDIGGNWIVAGYEGLSGEAGGSMHDLDGAVRKLAPDGRDVWDDNLRPDDPPTLDDRFVDVLVDPTTNDVLAVGFENVGTDNAENADYDARAYYYGALGYFGSPAYLWDPPSVGWIEPGNQRMTATAFDPSGSAWVVGTVSAKGGGEQLRVVELNLVDGSEIQRWEGAPHPRVWPATLDVTADRVVISGWVQDGDDADLYVVSLGADSDGDGVADSHDPCPADPDKLDPGVCGCGIADEDVDGDGLLTCEDDCPSDPQKSEPLECGCGVPEDDGDSDGTPNCNDACATDPGKTEPGICGCGISDGDDDGDGFVTCQDQCPDSEPGVPVDAVGCEIGETGDTGVEEDKAPVDDGGCGCQAVPGAAGSPWLFAAFLMWQRRRRNAG